MQCQNVINQFAGLLRDARVQFCGNVQVGRDVRLEELRRTFHAVRFELFLWVCLDSELFPELGVIAAEVYVTDRNQQSTGAVIVTGPHAFPCLTSNRTRA